MKPHFKPLATILAATLQLAAIAAVPLAWDVRPGQPAPVTFDRYHGETLEFSATFRGFGALPFAGDADIRLWYQTNGMGSSWWSAPATIQSNVLSATWSPSFDPGADRVSLFFGAPSNAYAAAVLSLRHSPGFRPGAMPDPESFRETDPVFAAWLATYTPPDTSLAPATNYTDAATNALAATMLSRSEAEAGFTSWRFDDESLMDGSHVAEVREGWSDEAQGVRYYDLYVDGQFESSYTGPIGETSIEFTWQGDGHVTATRTRLRPTAEQEEYWNTKASHEDATNAAEAVVAPVAEALGDLRTETSLVYRLYSGSNVVAEVTNYNSAVHAPELRLMQLNESNEYFTVWTEANGLSRTLKSAKEYTDGATGAVVNASAPRAWSKVTAGMGVEAPSNTTWLSTGRTVIAGGLEYEKHLTSGGAIWLLESNGMAADFHAQTNNTAYLDISAGDGTSIFRIEKTDSFLVGVSVDNVSVENGSALVCGVNVVAAEHPLVRVKASLSDASWSKEEDGTESGGVTTISGLATIAWTGTTGNWTCRITNLTGGNTLFAQMEYLQEGGTKIVNSAALDVSEGILCTDGIHKCRPVYSNGNITWEVVP